MNSPLIIMTTTAYSWLQIQYRHYNVGFTGSFKRFWTFPKKLYYTYHSILR